MNGALMLNWMGLFAMLSFGVLARKIRGSWLAPSVFPAILWFFYAAVPLMVLPDRVSPSTIWLVFSFVFATQLGSFLMEEILLPGPVHVACVKVNLDKAAGLLFRLSLVFTLASGIGSLVYFVENLRKFDLPYSLEGILGLGTFVYSSLVEGEADPWWFRLLRMWTYPAALLSGMFVTLPSERWKKVLSLAVFLPALLAGLAAASRYGTGLCVALWVAGYLGMRAYFGGRRIRLNATVPLWGLALLGFCIATYVALGVVRGHKHEDVQETSSYVRSNIFGYLAVFDAYVQHQEHRGMSFGAYTFAAFFELTGLKERELALGYEPVFLESGITSNIYTAFRGLVEDFSYPGAILVCTVSGFLAGWAYSAVTQGRMAGIVVLAAYYAFLIWSPFTSILNYNSVYAALFIVWIFTRIVQSGYPVQIVPISSRRVHA